jgi:hypothetical protein
MFRYAAQHYKAYKSVPIAIGATEAQSMDERRMQKNKQHF